MAKEEDSKSIRRRREKEDEEEESQKSQKTTGTASGAQPMVGISPTAHIDDQIKRADTLIDQLNHIYQMFVAGVEKLPPNATRKILDQLMVSLQSQPKPTQSIQFRYSGLNAKYITYRDRWDKMMKDMESGKIRR